MWGRVGNKINTLGASWSPRKLVNIGGGDLVISGGDLENSGGDLAWCDLAMGRSVWHSVYICKNRQKDNILKIPEGVLAVTIE